MTIFSFFVERYRSDNIPSSSSTAQFGRLAVRDTINLYSQEGTLWQLGAKTLSVSSIYIGPSRGDSVSFFLACGDLLSCLLGFVDLSSES